MAQPTSLYDFHLAHNAFMVDFAGAQLPLHYGSMPEEHQAVRESAGFFDVSHMGQFLYYSKTATTDLEAVLPIDLQSLPNNKGRYGLMLNEKGGIIDDLIITKIDDNTYALVLNAARIDVDLAHLQKHLPQALVRVDQTLIALQGPKSQETLLSIFSSQEERKIIDAMRFMDRATLSFQGVSCVLQRCGYTGEDGFELSIPHDKAPTIAQMLVEKGAVACGLAVRDMLRLEAGLCLYGQDLDEETTPNEARLRWSLRKNLSDSPCIGSQAVIDQHQKGIQRIRVGLVFEGKRPLRAEQLIELDGTIVGKLTSTSVSKILDAPFAMAYLDKQAEKEAKNGAALYASLRGTKIPAKLVSLPFIPTHYRID